MNYLKNLTFALFFLQSIIVNAESNGVHSVVDSAKEIVSEYAGDGSLPFHETVVHGAVSGFFLATSFVSAISYKINAFKTMEEKNSFMRKLERALEQAEELDTIFRDHAKNPYWKIYQRNFEVRDVLAKGDLQSVLDNLEIASSAAGAKPSDTVLISQLKNKLNGLETFTKSFRYADPNFELIKEKLSAHIADITKAPVGTLPSVTSIVKNHSNIDTQKTNALKDRHKADAIRNSHFPKLSKLLLGASIVNSGFLANDILRMINGKNESSLSH